MKNNKKVPIAILSCFLIVFLLQGILKLCGVFIFEKALYWDIFKIIDSSKIETMIYYSIINLIAIYCLSFALTKNCYSKKWYHYIIMILTSFGITSLKLFCYTNLQLQFIYDIISYVLVPVIINVTTNPDNRIFKRLNLTNIVILISIQILLYFAYLGLCYWSSLLSSIVITNLSYLPSSTTFLISFELYLGLCLLMLSLNNFIKYKGEEQ